MDNGGNDRAALDPAPVIEVEFTGAARLRIPALRRPNWRRRWSGRCADDPDSLWCAGVDRHWAHRHAARHERAGSAGARRTEARSPRRGSVCIPGRRCDRVILYDPNRNFLGIELDEQHHRTATHGYSRPTPCSNCSPTTRATLSRAGFYGKRVRDAPRPEIIPDTINLRADFAGSIFYPCHDLN
jgi:hypothetical protein